MLSRLVRCFSRNKPPIHKGQVKNQEAKDKKGISSSGMPTASNTKDTDEKEDSDVIVNYRRFAFQVVPSMSMLAGYWLTTPPLAGYFALGQLVWSVVMPLSETYATMKEP